MVIKKILNWTAGGFFRSLGRILVYAVIGFIIAMFFTKNNVSIPELFGFEKVYAAELKPWLESGARVYVDDHGTLTPTAWQTNPYTFNVTYPVTNMQFRLRATDGLSAENSYTFEFGYLPTPDAISVNRVYMKKTGDYDNEDITCNTWRRNSNGYYLLKCSFVPRENYTSSEYLYVNIVFNQAYLTSIRSYVYGYDERLGTNAVITDTGNNIINNNNQNTQDIINNITNATTNINNGLNALTDSQKVCSDINISKEDIEIDGRYLVYQTGDIGISENYGITKYFDISNSNLYVLEPDTLINNAGMCFYNSNKVLISCLVENNLVVNSQVSVPNNTVYARFTISKLRDKPKFTYKSCKNGNQALSDDLKDDNVEGDTNDMADFLNDYEFSNDGLLTSLVMAPINFLSNVLSNDSTDDFCRTFRGKNICLPNGKILWNSNHSCNEDIMLCDSNSSVADFKLYFSLVVGGYLCYKMLTSFVRTSENAIDPNQNKVEVMSL